MCCHTARFTVSLVCWVKLSSMPSSENFNLEHADLCITIVRQFPLARQTADELSSWTTAVPYFLPVACPGILAYR